MKLTNETRHVYTNDGYGGVAKLELDWGQDVIWERGELNDGFSSIQEHFENRSNNWYASIRDLFNVRDEFTNI